MLKKQGFNVGEMHSDLSQSERDEIMYQYKSHKIDIIVATDILARGMNWYKARILEERQNPDNNADKNLYLEAMLESLKGVELLSYKFADLAGSMAVSDPCPYPQSFQSDPRYPRLRPRHAPPDEARNRFFTGRSVGKSGKGKPLRQVRIGLRA